MTLSYILRTLRWGADWFLIAVGAAGTMYFILLLLGRAPHWFIF